MISEGELLGLGFREDMIECFWDWEAERIRRVPADGWWRWRRCVISLWRPRPVEITTRPPPPPVDGSSSSRSAIMCS